MFNGFYGIVGNDSSIHKLDLFSVSVLILQGCNVQRDFMPKFETLRDLFYLNYHVASTCSRCICVASISGIRDRGCVGWVELRSHMVHLQ